MFSSRVIGRSLCVLVFGAGWLMASHPASAQQQDRKLFDRIMTPNMELHAEGFGKAFVPASGSENRSFLTRLFGGSHPAATKAGNGWFHAPAFISNKEGYAGSDFATKRAAVGGQEGYQANRTFESRAVPVNDDRAAGKTAVISSYEPGGREFVPQGKRQDDIDDLRRQKNLTSEQVREILNKNK